MSSENGGSWARDAVLARAFRRSSDATTRGTNDVKMPPAIGAAIRFHTSDPVPVAHMIGIRPTNIVATVINFGRSRFAAPSTIAACRSASVRKRPAL